MISEFYFDFWINTVMKLCIFITIFIVNLYLINFPILMILIEKLKVNTYHIFLTIKTKVSNTMKDYRYKIYENMRPSLIG